MAEDEDNPGGSSSEGLPGKAGNRFVPRWRSRSEGQASEEGLHPNLQQQSPQEGPKHRFQPRWRQRAEEIAAKEGEQARQNPPPENRLGFQPRWRRTATSQTPVPESNPSSPPESDGPSEGADSSATDGTATGKFQPKWRQRAEQKPVETNPRTNFAPRWRRAQESGEIGEPPRVHPEIAQGLEVSGGLASLWQEVARTPEAGFEAQLAGPHALRPAPPTGELPPPPEVPARTVAPAPPSGGLAAPPEVPRTLSPAPPSGGLAAPPEVPRTFSPAPPSGGLAAPPEVPRTLSPAPPSGGLAAPPEPPRSLSPAPPSGGLAAPPEGPARTVAPAPPSGGLAAPPEPPRSLSPAPPSGGLAAPPQGPARMVAPASPSGGLAAPPEPPRSLSPAPPSGGLAAPPQGPARNVAPTPSPIGDQGVLLQGPAPNPGSPPRDAANRALPGPSPPSGSLVEASLPRILAPAPSTGMLPEPPRPPDRTEVPKKSLPGPSDSPSAEFVLPEIKAIHETAQMKAIQYKSAPPPPPPPPPPSREVQELSSKVARPQRSNVPTDPIEPPKPSGRPSSPLVYSTPLSHPKRATIKTSTPDPVKKKRKVHRGRDAYVAAEDVSTFTRQLAVMINAGLPLHQALCFFADSSKGRLADIIDDVATKISSGHRLSNAMAQSPDVFSEVYVGLIELGESTSHIDEALEKLADLLEKQVKLSKRLSSALIYPAFLVAVSFAAVGLFLQFVLPTMIPLFTGFGMELPWPTQVLLFSRHLVWPSVFLALASVVGFRWFRPRWNRARRLRENWALKVDRQLLKVPVLGKFLGQMATARILFALATMIETGLPLLAAMKKCEGVASNLEVASRLERAGCELRDGATIAEALHLHDVLPTACIHLIAAGEESAHMAEMVQYSARFYEEEVEHAVGTFMNLIEPVIMVVMGLVVGFIVVSAVLPTVQMIDHLGG